MLLQAAVPAPPPARVTNPGWLQRPSAQSLDAHYPAEARRNEVEGKAAISCGVGIDGRLQDCRVVSEEPEGAGFGQAALAIAWEFRMTPRTVDDRPVEGGTVRVPITFTLAPPVSRREAPFALAQYHALTLRSLGEEMLAWVRQPENATALGAVAAVVLALLLRLARRRRRRDDQREGFSREIVRRR